MILSSAVVGATVVVGRAAAAIAVGDPWEVPFVPLEAGPPMVIPKAAAPTTPPKAMPALSVTSVHLPESVVEARLAKQEELAVSLVTAEEAL